MTNGHFAAFVANGTVYGIAAWAYDVAVLVPIIAAQLATVWLLASFRRSANEVGRT